VVERGKHLKIREQVQEWFSTHRHADYDAAVALQYGLTTKELKHYLVQNYNFPFSRDSLEIWRRWAEKQSFTLPNPTDLDDIYETFHEDIYEEEKEEELLDDEAEEPLTSSRLYVILPDQQIPYHDRELHELVLRWLNVNQPYGKVYSGDLIDLPGISRHEWDPAMDPDPLKSTMTAIRDTRTYLKECESAAGKGDDYLCEGNHEARLPKYLIKHAPHLYALEEPNGERTLDLARLLDLPARGIQLAPGGWPQGKVWLSPKLSVMHGWLARSKSGVTAHATLDHLGHSVIVGHTHRMGKIYQTRHTYDGLEVHVAAEAGTLARIEGGLGYATAANWQNGFITARVFPDGTFSLSEAVYVKKRLYWEGQVYDQGAKGVRVAA
jgi:hypothetical protein